MHHPPPQSPSLVHCLCINTFPLTWSVFLLSKTTSCSKSILNKLRKFPQDCSTKPSTVFVKTWHLDYPQSNSSSIWDAVTIHWQRVMLSLYNWCCSHLKKRRKVPLLNQYSNTKSLCFLNWYRERRKSKLGWCFLTKKGKSLHLNLMYLLHNWAEPRGEYKSNTPKSYLHIKLYKFLQLADVFSDIQQFPLQLSGS